MKTDHRVLLWCVAAWMCCVVVNCRVEFFGADGNALREADILDNDWFVKDDGDKISKDSYRKKSYAESFLNEPDEDEDNEAECIKKCGKDDKIRCVKNGEDLLCLCPDTENGAKQGFDYDGKKCEECNCGGNFKNCSFIGGEEKCTCNDKFALKENICSECDCGDEAKSCSYDAEGKKVCECNDNYKEHKGKCLECDCGDKAKSCSYDAEDKKVCECNDNYKEYNGKCLECDCGDEAKSCSYDAEGKKVCECNDNYKEHKGKCLECDCGDKAKSCSYNAEDKKVCECNDNYKEYNGKCLECDCGNEAKSCSYDAEGKKVCECNDNYKEHKGKCLECDCGDKAKSCSYNAEDKKVCECNDNYKEYNGKCLECDCGNEAKSCSYDAEGKKVCECNDNYKEHKGKCLECDCGDKAKSCSYNAEDKKVCECHDNYKEYNGKCLECDCGNEAKSCSYDAEGKKVCECNDNYKEHKGKCLECDCGDKAKSCSYDAEDKKVCECNDNYKEYNGKCFECDCGDKAKSCSHDAEGKKVCECNDNYKEHKGKCLECDCGDKAKSCSHDAEGKKVCECNDNYKEHKGKCLECDCGDKAKSCSHDAEGKKVCECNDNYKEHNGKCLECDCGGKAKSCSHDAEGKKVCECNDNYKEHNGKCLECDCGKNATGCSFGKDGKKECTCKDQYKEVEGKCYDERCVSKCGVKEGVICNLTGDKADCECSDTAKKFHPTKKECKVPCIEGSDCKNAAECEEIQGEKFCECHVGTSGDTCENVLDCPVKYKNCSGGLRGICKFDTRIFEAVCECMTGRKLKDQSGYCAACDCGDNQEDCEFVKDKKVCKCKPGYSDKDGICDDCDCGPNSTKCSFKDGKKVCGCKEGFGDDGTTCQQCNCGENIKGCTFKDGKQNLCICKDKFALKDNECKACDCGEHSNRCSYNKDGKKVCDCKTGYKENNGICKECKCGNNSLGCEFENGNKKCKCKEKFAQNGDQCEACECGNHEKCRFENGARKCDCVDKYAKNNEGNCTECKCGAKSKGCTFKEENTKECHCEVGYGDNGGTCTEDKCYTKCGVPPEGHEEADCNTEKKFGDGTDIKCSCHDENLKFDLTMKKCRKTCDKDVDGKKCQNSATCVQRDTEKFCKCLDNTAGYYCEILTECGKGQKYEKCTGDKGECKYNKDNKKAECKCKENKTLDEREGYCQDNCNTDEDCSKYNKICFKGSSKSSYCRCENGKKGDNCEIATGCTEDLKKKCEDAGAVCAFNKEATNFAACVCKDSNLVYNEKDKKCVAKFCNDVGCKDSGKCEFDPDTKTAYCKCPNGKYYNYNTQKCSAPDKCLLKKSPCKENEVCEGGACKCKGEEKDGKCIIKFCVDKKCFDGATCDEESRTCKCGDGKYFTGSSCKDLKCIKDPFAENCGCGWNMKVDSETKKCVPSDDKKSCDKDCGLGYCVDDKCRCISGISKLKDGKCVLNEDICASEQLTKDSSKCNCTDKFKQANDGITCELATCSDDVVKEKCKNERATCEMSWNGTSLGYACKCPAGYIKNKELEICSDSCSVYEIAAECSLNNQVCYNSYSSSNPKPYTCDCPPPFKTKNKDCNDVAEYAYLISGIPVMKQRYQMENGIDYVKLNSDLMQSLSQMYNKEIFDSGYLHNYVEDGDVLKTSVWVRFNHNISGQLRRFKLQAQSFPNGTCDDCDTDLYMWPPYLVLKGNDFKDVKTESLSVCASAMKNTLCGEEAECDDNKCYCPRGYRTLEYTIKSVSDGKARILRCEKTNVADLDECALGTHKCSGNTTCSKIPGSYICKCKPGYWKSTENDQKDCVDVCTPSPCGKGTCSMKKDKFNCKCQAGYGGSYCDEEDVNFASAKKSTVVVGAVLGTILIVGVLAALFFYLKKRKSSYSEDFSPAPRQDIASEMRERRPIRGVVNTSYE